MMLFGNGDRYDGDWTGGKIEGKGVMSYGTGEKYKGDFFNSKLHGHGIYTLADGTTFEGEFEDGFRIVNGVRFWANGEPLEESADEPDEKQPVSPRGRSGSSAETTPTVSSNVSTASRFNAIRKNMTLNRAIEDIKRKNVANSKK